VSNEIRPSETIVVGAGIIGLSLAYELLRRGRQVTVLERDRPGRGSTWAAGGMLAPVSEAEVDEPEVITLGLESLDRYPEFVAGVERVSGMRVGYLAEGTLLVAVNRDDREELQRVEEILRRKRLEVERVDGEGLREVEPHFSSRVLAGLRIGRDHQVDPRRLVVGLQRAIEELGGQVLGGMRVEGIVERGGSVRSVRGRRLGGESFEWAGSEVVLAAGAWSFEGIELPIADPGLRPVKGQLVRVRGERLLRHVVRTPDVYLIPREDGELLVGATMEEMGYDQSATAGAVMDLLRHAWEVLPAIYDLELSEISVGLRSALEDQRPLIGATAVDGLYLALGHHRNGILLAPASAHHLACRIVEGRAPAELEPFSPRRPTVGQSSKRGGETTDPEVQKAKR
jgi:glycine oxidase